VQCALVFLMYLLFTANTIVALPEHLGISNGLLSLAFIIPLVITNTRLRTTALGFLTVPIGGTTITNAVFPLASLAQESLKSRYMRIALGVITVLGLAGFVLFFAEPERVGIVIDRILGGRGYSINWFIVTFLNNRLISDPWGAGTYAMLSLVYPVIGPAPYVRAVPGSLMMVSYSPFVITEYSWIQLIGVIAWVVLLGTCVFNGHRDGRTRRFVWLLVLWLGFNGVFHNVWGDEYFLFSPHWSWALMGLVILGVRHVSLKFTAAMVFPIVIGQIIALNGIGLALRSIEVRGDFAKKLDDIQVAYYARGPGYSEGPTWRDGEVFFSSGALFRVTKDGQIRKHLDINPSGTFLRSDGHILICDNKNKALLDLSPDGKVGVIVEQFRGKPLNSLNDLTVDRSGSVYWTDPAGSSIESPVGNVFRVRPDGRVDKIATGLAYPNGIDVDPANKYLYLIESLSKKILRYRLPPDDEPLGEPTVFFELGGSGGDGLAFDEDGNIWVADFHHPEAGQGRIVVISPQAKLLSYVKIPAKYVSNITFGGTNHDEIFVTTGGPPGIFHASVGMEGFRGHPGKVMKIVRYLDIKIME